MQRELAVVVKALLFRAVSRKIFCFLFFWVFSSIMLECNGQTTQFASLWVRYFNQTRLTNRLTLNAHLDERILFNPTRQFQLFTHIHLNFLIKPWLDVGVGGNFNFTNAAANPHLMVPEWRPWQEATLIKSIAKKWQFQFRYRVDERFIHANNGQELQSGYNFNWRHRFRPQFSYSFQNQGQTKKYVFRISNEFMVNTGDVRDTFDQNRFYCSIEQPLGKKWSMETGYMNQLQSRAGDDGYNERHLIRVSVYHKVDLRKVD